MSEIKNMFLPSIEIFRNLKEYIQVNASVETYVSRNKITNKFPLIVFEEARNELDTRSTTYDNTTRTLNYNINIYCNHRVDNYELCIELANLITQVMQGYYKMSGGVIATIPTFEDANKTSYQVNMRFTSRFIPSRNKLF